MRLLSTQKRAIFLCKYSKYSIFKHGNHSRLSITWQSFRGEITTYSYRMGSAAMCAVQCCIQYFRNTCKGAFMLIFMPGTQAIESVLLLYEVCNHECITYYC